jgi:hypothetical protein
VSWKACHLLPLSAKVRDTPGGNVTGIPQGWVIESIEPARYEVRPDLKDLTFSEGGPRAWLSVIRRA